MIASLLFNDGDDELEKKMGDVFFVASRRVSFEKW